MVQQAFLLIKGEKIPIPDETETYLPNMGEFVVYKGQVYEVVEIVFNFDNGDIILKVE